MISSVCMYIAVVVSLAIWGNNDVKRWIINIWEENVSYATSAFLLGVGHIHFGWEVYTCIHNLQIIPIHCFKL